MSKIQEAIAAAKGVEASFQETLKIRGKKRDPAIEQWFKDHKEHAFAMAYGLLQEKSKSRRDLGAKFIGRVPSDEKTTEALAQMCGDILAGGKPSLYPVALNLLRRRSALIAPALPTLGRFITRAPEGAQALSALELVASAAGKDGGPTQEELAGLYDQALDHWSTDVQQRAAELLVEQGGQARASMWEGCPLAESVRRQISRLGGTIVGTPDPEAPRPAGQWEGLYGELADYDPSAQVDQIPWPIAYFDRHVRLPHGLDDYDRDFQRSYGSGSGMNYVHREGGQMRFFADILYEDIGQWYVCLDLTDAGADPKTIGYDHEGWMRGGMGSLSRFLSTLKAP